MARKTNQDYEKFCDALDAAGHGRVTRTLLMELGNLLFYSIFIHND